jgi:hypothetical protein
MAILEINLEKPALIEEYQYPEKRSESTSQTGATASGSKSSGGGMKGKLVGLLVVLTGVGAVVWKLKGGGSTEQTDFDEFDEGTGMGEESEYEHGPEPDIGADESDIGGNENEGRTRTVAGLLGFVVAVVAVVTAARKARN